VYDLDGRLWAALATDAVLEEGIEKHIVEAESRATPDAGAVRGDGEVAGDPAATSQRSVLDNSNCRFPSSGASTRTVQAAATDAQGQKKKKKKKKKFSLVGAPVAASG